MKHLFSCLLLVFTLCSSFTGCHKDNDLGLTMAVTVDFSGQGSDHSVLTFVGEQHQGTYHVFADNGTVQTIHLPHWGTYTIDWSFNPPVPSSATFYLDDVDGVDLEQMLEQPGAADPATGLTLSSKYTFRSTVR